MTARGKKRRATGWIKTQEDPARIGPLMRKAGFVADDADPLEVMAWFDQSGTPKRVQATYANGWVAKLSLRKDGGYSLTQSFRMVSRKAELV